MRLTILAFARGVDLIPDSKKLSASMQDYLEAILELEGRGHWVNEIANKPGIVKKIIKHLHTQEGLVRLQDYTGIEHSKSHTEKVKKYLAAQRFSSKALWIRRFKNTHALRSMPSVPIPWNV